MATTVDAIYLTIRDAQFRCRRVGTSWQMMQFAKAQQAANSPLPQVPEYTDEYKAAAEKRNTAGMKMLAILFDTAMVLLRPEERGRFSDFMDTQSMSEQGIDPGELEQAIGEVIAAAAGEPGKQDTTSSQRSSVSSQTTSGNYVDDSLSRDMETVSLPDVT